MAVASAAFRWGPTDLPVAENSRVISDQANVLTGGMASKSGALMPPIT